MTSQTRQLLEGELLENIKSNFLGGSSQVQRRRESPGGVGTPGSGTTGASFRQATGMSEGGPVVPPPQRANVIPNPAGPVYGFNPIARGAPGAGGEGAAPGQGGAPQAHQRVRSESARSSSATY